MIPGTPGNYVILGSRGNDVITGNGGGDKICPTDGNYYLKSGPATLADLSRITGIRRQRLTVAAERGEVPLRKIGGRWYSRFEWIHAWYETGAWNPGQIERAPEPLRTDDDDI